MHIRKGNNISAVSRLTWTNLQIVQCVVYEVQQSCTIKKMSRERGFAEMIVAFEIIEI